jgi:hypothetical protein
MGKWNRGKNLVEWISGDLSCGYCINLVTKAPMKRMFRT